MCTVTYLPFGNSGFILTSNRDETPERETLAPDTYFENGVKMTYPKDTLAGGTWVGVSDLCRLICLLNGGFEKHQRASAYKMSRGSVVKKLLAERNPIEYFTSFDCHQIEPFTMVLVDWSENLVAYELVWDGTQKYVSELAQEPKIWSSSTLYDEHMKKERREWFQEWLVQHPSYTEEDIVAFHMSQDKGTIETALQMKRSYVETVSVTTFKKTTSSEMIYRDLLASSVSKIEF